MKYGLLFRTEEKLHKNREQEAKKKNIITSYRKQIEEKK